MKTLLLLLLVTSSWLAHATISEITAAECTANGITCTPGTVAVGDLGIAFAYRSNSNTAPSAMTGWTTSTTACGGANTNSCRVACSVATTTSFSNVPSSANATQIIVLVFRGAGGVNTASCATTGMAAIGTVAANGSTGTSLGYNTISLSRPAGTSWVVGCAGHVTATNVNQSPTGMTLQQSTASGSMAACSDTQAGVTSWSTQSVTVNASSGWRTYTMEILPALCSNTALGGGFTCVQSCLTLTPSGTSTNCVFPANVTSGNVVATMYLTGGTGTLSITGCSPVTFTQPDTTVAVSTYRFNHAWGTAASTGACTVTGNATGGPSVMDIMAVEISGSSGTIDQHAIASTGSITTPNPVSAPNVTTTVNGELVLSQFQDAVAGGTKYTAGTGYFLLVDLSTGRQGTAIQGEVQTTAGSITPTVTADNTQTFIASTITLNPATGGSTSPTQAGAFVIQ